MFLTANAHASLFDFYGFGSRGKAMGNALTAGALDYHAVYYNPAQLMAHKYAHAGVGFNHVEPQLKVNMLTDEGTEALLPSRNMGFHIGVSTPIGGVFRNKIAFGAAFFVPLLRLTRGETVDYGTPQFYMYENLPDKLLVLLGIAGQPWDWLSLGLGLQISGDISGQADIQLSLVDQQVTRRRMSIDLHAKLALTAGMTVTPTEGLNFAVSFREAVDLSYRLPIKTLIEEVGYLNFMIEGSGLYSPHQLNFGVNWKLAAAPLTLSADLTWAMWSTAPSPAPNTSVVIDDSAIREEPEAIVDVQSTHIVLDAKDIVIPRFGAEYEFAPFRVRAGYFYQPTPVPTQVHETNYVDCNAHGFTLGGSWRYQNGPDLKKSALAIGLAFQVTHLSERTVAKVNPTAENSSYTAGGNIFSAVADIQLDF